MAKSQVTYQLSIQHAITLYIALPSSFEPDPIKAEAVNAKADIKLSKDSFIFDPGASGTIEVTATDPSGLGLERLPIWSGWVIANGTDDTSLSIPYLGLAGSPRSAGRIHPGQPVLKIPGLIENRRTPAPMHPSSTIRKAGRNQDHPTRLSKRMLERASTKYSSEFTSPSLLPNCAWT